MLIVALRVIDCHAYAGHGDTNSFNALAGPAILREVIGIRLIRMKIRSRVVYALEKLLSLRLALGQRDNGRYREFHEFPLPLLIGNLILLSDPSLTL